MDNGPTAFIEEDDYDLQHEETNVLFIKEEKISDDEDEMDNEGNISGNESKLKINDNEDVCGSLQDKEIEYIKCEVDVCDNKNEMENELEPLDITNDQLNNSCANNKASALVDNCSTLPSPTSDQVDSNNTSSNLNSKKEDTGCSASRWKKVQMNNCLNNNCLLECTECGFSTTNKLIFRRHVKIHNPFKCKVCDYCCNRRDYLVTHMYSHTGEKPYKCKECEYSTVQRNSLLVHMRKHTGERPFKCTECDYASSQLVHLQNHVRIHSGDRPYKCTVCSYAAIEERSLLVHMRKHTGERPYKCSQCDYTAKCQSSLRMHVRTHTGERPYKCLECDYSAKSKPRLKRHIVVVHIGKKPAQPDTPKCSNLSNDPSAGSKTEEHEYKCTKCQYSSPQEENITIHFNLLHGEKSLKCTYCEYSTHCKYKFKIHLRTHTGERPHSCTVCGKSFAQTSGLRTHMKIHTGEKPFKCTLCDYSSVQSHHVTSHMRTVHTKEKPFKCTECEFTTAHQNSLTSHMRLHTGECPFICPQCDFSAARRASLKKHLKTHIVENVYM